jgi:hypothetical protein
MARRHKDDGISSPAEKAIISQFSRSTLKRTSPRPSLSVKGTHHSLFPLSPYAEVNPDGSKPQVFGAGKGWQGGVIAVTGPANPNQQVLTRDESLPPPTKSAVQNPTRLLQQYRLQQNRQVAAPGTPSPPPSANNAQEPPPRPAASLPAASPSSMSTSAPPHRTVSKHAPPPSAPAPKAPAPPTTTMSASSAWAPPSTQPPPPPPAHPRPPVENGSAWKDYVGDQPADTVQVRPEQLTFSLCGTFEKK